MAPIPTREYCIRMAEEVKTGTFWRDVISELFSTFLFVAGVLLLRQNWYGAQPQSHVIQVAVGTAFLWVSIGYGLGDFGGAHMNNAVTFACLIRKEITLVRALFYWIMQAGGAIGAAFVVHFITPPGKQAEIVGDKAIADDVEWWGAVTMEAFVTAILCFAYLGSFGIERKGYVILSSLPVGLAAGLGVFLAMPYTKAIMNSMLYLGPAVVGTVFFGADVWGIYWIYWAGPMGGGFLAAILYWILDSVDSVENSQSPYYMQSGTWSYNNAPPMRPQVMPNSRMPRMRSDSNGKEILNRPSAESEVYKVNGVAASDNGHVSAYSRGIDTYDPDFM